MSHIAEVYAKDLGVKIGKPIICDHFYPGLPEKYVTFHASNKMPSKNYKYWDLVISLIKPHIKDIKIVQVGGPKDEKIDGVDFFMPSSYRQMNYIIKNSKGHFGVDSLPMHVASVYDKSIVCLFSNIYKENAKPLWNKANKVVCLEPDFKQEKPSFSTNCDRINEIKPEKISQQILNFLEIFVDIKFKTIKIGNAYHSKTVEIIPNFSAISPELENKAINIRGDIHWDSENIVRWCQFSFVNLYVDSVFDTNLLQWMPNLKQVIFKYKEDGEKDLTYFFKILKSKKINILIELQGEANASDVRLRYFDYNVMEAEKPHEKISAQKFISKKRFVSEAEVFHSESSAKRLDKSNNFIYDDVSSKELENLYLYDER